MQCAPLLKLKIEVYFWLCNEMETAKDLAGSVRQSRFNREEMGGDAEVEGAHHSEMV